MKILGFRLGQTALAGLGWPRSCWGRTLETDDQIDLARASPFQIGTLRVEPAIRQISITSTAVETLEPRVMQVLVALASAQGAVVSRDELIRRCWGGRIVGEDSISRTIARLRKLADDHPEAGFRIETITKVGYRLVGTAVPDAPGLAMPPADDADVAVHLPVPKARRWWPVVVAGLVIVALLVVIWRVTHPAPQNLRATLRIGSFRPLNAGIPPALPKVLESEFLEQNSILTNRRITIVSRSPANSTQAYLVSGSLRRTPDDLILIVNLSHEGGDTLLSQSFELPADGSDAAIADTVAKVTTNVQCTMTYAIQGRTEPLPPATERLLAQWCRANNAAAVGPCIAQRSYEVDSGFRDRFLADDPEHDRFFIPGKPGHFQFDIEAMVASRLAAEGLRHIELLGQDTYAQPDRYFSFRRTTHAGEGDYGRQLSVIALG